MNKAITDGLYLMPPAFSAGLGVWSSGDGTPGSTTYQGAANAALVPADQDFGHCLELTKTASVQKLRYMGETPVLPGCYLRVSARIKAVSGALPSVRIAAWAGSSSFAHVNGLVEVGPSVALTAYGEVVTVTAIIGTGARGGVNMAWGTGVTYAHVGLDLTGASGGTVRIDAIEVEDVTGWWLRDMMDWVDVRDFGAKGDGVTDDRGAFLAADAAAAGRDLLVPAGTYRIGSNLALTAPVRFVGTLSMPVNARLALLKSFDYPTYVAAFGDETLAFKKAIQALLGFSDHNVLDLRGRRIEVTEPIDLAAAVPDVTTFSNRRVVQNGQFNVIDGPAWAPTVVTSQASYATTAPTQLTNVVNIANIPVGARVSGAGVGREVYVKARNVGDSSLTLSQPLHGGGGTRVLTFTRYKYVLDFSGFAQIDRFTINEVEFLCNGIGSGILLAPAGDSFQLRDSYMVRPRDRGITSIGRGCQDIQIDRCQFLSNEMQLRAQDRSSIALNINANDAKIRDSRFVRFGHFLVANGTGHLIVGNHWFQGDEELLGVRQAGLVLTNTNVQTAITGNYIDNSVIEWTNEHAVNPNYANQYSFGGLTITGNTFVCIDVAPWFRWISVKPYGAGHFLHGLSVTGNVFKALNGSIDRVEGVDTSFAALDYERMRNVVFENNIFNAVTQLTASPVFLQYDQATAQTVWTVDPGAYLPFGGWARNVESVVAEGMITNATGTRVAEMPHVIVEQGAAKNQVTLNWSQASKGRVHLRVRVDNPN